MKDFTETFPATISKTFVKMEFTEKRSKKTIRRTLVEKEFTKNVSRNRSAQQCKEEIYRKTFQEHD